MGIPTRVVSGLCIGKPLLMFVRSYLHDTPWGRVHNRLMVMVYVPPILVGFRSEIL